MAPCISGLDQTWPSDQWVRAAQLHLFVQERSHATAVYCGTVTPVRHQGSAPIDLWFRLPVAVPPGVMAGLGE